MLIHRWTTLHTVTFAKLFGRHLVVDADFGFFNGAETKHGVPLTLFIAFASLHGLLADQIAFSKLGFNFFPIVLPVQ